MKNLNMDIQPPSFSLPLLRNLTAHSLNTISVTLINLRALYWPTSLLPTSVSLNKLHNKSERIPDSGYASAEEGDVEEEEQMETLRADAMERAFAVRWLTGFIARSEQWIMALPSADQVQERENRSRIVEEAASLLALSAHTGADGVLARHFSFAAQEGRTVTLELKDEPYEEDHQGVGLQTWGSACVLAGLVCAHPGAFGLTGQVRVLELGAGTGLLSMAVATLCPHLEVVATDFHPAVLANLRRNIARNFTLGSNAVRVEMLDWADPPVPEEKDKFDIILAADVIYNVQHGGWIKNCAEGLLRRAKGPAMWMIVPRRPTRESEIERLEEVFGLATGRAGLKILEVEIVERQEGVGRADEVGYMLFSIGWMG